MTHDLVVLYEHPEWQKPLFAALDARGVDYAKHDLKQAAFEPSAAPEALVYFNQASPSAYVRGNARAVPYCYALMRSLEARGAKVLNGAGAFTLELSKSAQGALMTQLGIDTPRSLTFNDVETAIANWRGEWPLLVKPEQGGSGARIFLAESPDDLRRLFREKQDIWFPENLMMLQEYFPVDPTRGIVRLEFMDGELLYAMRVISHGAFNLCPSEVCNPESGEGHCEIPAVKPVAPVEFYPYPEVPAAAVEKGRKLMEAGGLDIGGIEYLEAADGRLVFYDVNANSNLRAPIAQAFGFEPFGRVVDFLERKIAEQRARRGL